MKKSQFEIKEVRVSEGHTIDIYLGSPEFNERARALMSDVVPKGCSVFLLSWEGGNIPSGAMVLGREISWTQNGAVSAIRTDPNPRIRIPEIIGTYDRLIKFGGTNQNHHLMLVFVRPEIERTNTSKSRRKGSKVKG